jgi:PBP superfamily domain
MDLVQDRAQLPTRLTYRQIDNITSAQDEFMDSITVTNSVDFGSGHVPLLTEHYSTLKEQGIDVLHFPHVLSAIGLYHAIPGIDQVNLTSCLISRILRREIKSWKNREILAQNPMLKDIAATHITVVRHGTASAVTKAYTEVGFICIFYFDTLTRVSRQYIGTCTDFTCLLFVCSI